MIQPLPSPHPNVLGFKLSGKLHDADYQQFVPVVDAAVKQLGKLRLLAHFEDFHGWDLHAIWDDTKFSLQHMHDIERIALVGDRQWEAWMAKVCKPFTQARLQYFDASQIAAAWQWAAE